MAAPKGNLYALGNNGGHPPKYETPEEMEEQIANYFQKCYEDNLWPTVTGLTLHLGFVERKSIYDYKKKDEFVHLIKKALATVEMSYEMRLNGQTCTGAIFALKNMGWVDKQTIEHDVTDKVEDIISEGKRLAKTYSNNTVNDNV